MKIERFQTVEDLFHRLRELPENERAARLTEVRANDAELADEVAALLASAEGATGRLRPRPGGEPSSEQAGTRIGRFKLLQRIGEGGFGVVWMAEQEQPLRRKVALKIIKAGMDTKQVVARFEAERQALALMDHPNIAKVLDGGSTEAGRPYFAMELVKGVPITEYCDANSLSTEERLALFVDVCRAVQHAHQKGVIHRDIKPSNVMVTLHDDRPVPKVIDFGIAKAMNQPLTDRTLFTEYRQFLGTPEYMSPEQAVMSGLDVDTRTDVYALGVLLYELLTGTTPFDPRTLRQEAFDEVLRIIREAEPPKPSTRVSTLGERLGDVARHRSVAPESLGRRIRGDLDWIVMRSLEKDRARRYASAGDFARDVLRHLEHEPVAAGPPGAAYRLRKFVLRNKAAVAVGGVVAAAVLVALAGLVLATLDRRRALAAEQIARAQTAAALEAREAERQQREIAEKSEEFAVEEAERSKAAIDFLLGTLSSVDPAVSGRKVSVASLLDQASERLDEGAFAGSPLVEAKVRSIIGRVLRDQHTDLDAAERELRRACELWKRQRPSTEPPAPGTVYPLLDLAAVADDRGDAEEAERIHREALELARWWSANDPGIVHTAATAFGDFLLRRTDRADEAKALFLEALKSAAYRHLAANPELWTTEAQVGRAMTARGELSNAEHVLEQALEKQREHLGDNHADVATTLLLLAELEDARGEWDAAETLYRESLAMRCELLQAHEDVAHGMIALGRFLFRRGRLAEAEEIFRELLHDARKRLGDDHPALVARNTDLARVLAAADRAAEAEELLDEAFALACERLGEDHPETAKVLALLDQVRGR